MRPDLIWFRTDKDVHWVTALTGASVIFHSVTATATARITEGPALQIGQWPRLRGTIEYIGVHAGTSAALKVDVLFTRKTGVASTLIDVDHVIDWESFVAADFEKFGAQTKPQRAARSGLTIPYVDSDGTAKFHVGIKNVASTTIPKNNLVVEWAFRPDPGID